MNCPECKTGVLEPIGFIELNENLRFTYSKFPPTQKPSLVIMLCSRGCDYVQIKSSPNTMSFVRTQLKESMYREYYREAMNR